MTDSPRSPYRKLVFATTRGGADANGGRFVELLAPRTGRGYRLNPAEFAVAQLFDGERDADAVRRAAREALEQDFSAEELEYFAGELATAGLLEAGAREPLPVPPRDQAAARNAGWDVHGDEDEPVPSIVPGSLGGPGRAGSVVGLWGVLRGQAEPIRVRLAVQPWLWFGFVGAVAAFSWVAAGILLAVVAGLLYGVGIHYGQAGLDALRLLRHWPILAIVAVFGSCFVNAFGQLARAAAIQRFTGTLPAFGLVFGFGLIPRFRTDTAGAPESAPRRARLGIVGATPAAQLLVFVVGALVWLMFRQGQEWLPVVALGVGFVALVFFLLDLNPLVKRDGYFLLAHALGVLDLREQAMLSLLGRQRKWREAKPAPPWALRAYGVAILVYVVWICAFLALYPGRWFVGHWGGTALVIFLLLMAYIGYAQLRRATSPRSRVGDIALKAPTRVHYAIACALAVVALLPFPFRPSGAFIALPAMRAELAALVDGPVTEVMVKEGDHVNAGQPIAKIGDDGEKSAVETAKAVVAKLEAQLALARGGTKPQEIELAKQNVEVARKRYTFSKLMADRVAAAHDKHAISDQQYDRAQQTAAVNQAEVIAAERKLALVQSPAQAQTIKAIQADIDKANAQLQYSEQRLRQTTIRAPIDGRVVSATLQFAVGQYVHRGDVFGHVEQSRELQIAIGLPEAQIGGVKPGAEAYAKVWTYPGRVFPGKVARIAPNVIDTPNGKIVRVTMTLDNQAGLLQPGMTGYAKIDAGTYPVILVFTRALYRFFFVEVWSWLP